MIIFDLDDTLIDTSFSVTPIVLENLLTEMVQRGLKLVSFHNSLKKLLTINQNSLSSLLAVENFLTLYHPHYSIDLSSLFKGITLPKGANVKLHEGAFFQLEELGVQHTLALVSYGNPAYQKEKMKKAGLDRLIFDKIILSKNRDKTMAYQEIFYTKKRSPDSVIVCGDRPEIDLVPAKKLGYHTIYVKLGRGKDSALHSSYLKAVDYSVDQWSKMGAIIKKIEEKVGRKTDDKK